MPSILNPFSNLVAPGNYQMPVGTDLGIDFTNALSNGLIGCWIPGAMGGVDLTGASPTLKVNPNASFSGTPDGPSLLSTNASGQDSMQATATAPYKYTAASGGLSIYWRGLISAQIVSGANSNICGIAYDNAGGSPYLVAAISPQLGSQYPGMSCLWNTGSITFFNIGGIVNNFNAMYSFGATFAGTGGNVVFYNNGVSAGSNAFAGSDPSTSATSQIIIGGDAYASSRTSNCLTNLCCFWNRALSAGEMMAMHLNPYAFVVSDEYDLPQTFIVVPPAFVLMPQIVM
jgi:hypothetical protein